VTQRRVCVQGVHRIRFTFSSLSPTRAFFRIVQVFALCDNRRRRGRIYLAGRRGVRLEVQRPYVETCLATSGLESFSSEASMASILLSRASTRAPIDDVVPTGY